MTSARRELPCAATKTRLPPSTGEDVLAIIGERARNRILQAFAAGRADVVTAPPDVDLLLAPFLARIVLVEAGQIAVVAFVEGLIPLFRQAGLPHFGQR